VAASTTTARAPNERPPPFYRHFDFRELDDRRLWRRLADIERALRP
jgi:hypothetical protein